MTTTESAPGLLLTPPPGFVALPLRADKPDDGTIEALAATLTPPTGEHTLPRYVTWFTHLLAEDAIRLYGQFTVDADAHDEPVLADLAAAVIPLDIDSDDQVVALREHRDVVVARLRQQYIARHPHAHTTVVRLTMGPAMVAVTAGEYRLPPDLTRHGHAAVLPRVAAECQLPTPDGAHIALLTASTAHEAACQAMLTATMRVANSIRVTRQPAAATPS